MSKPTYEETIKRAKTNADCGEHLSPAEVTELLSAFEAQVKQLAAENAVILQDRAVILEAFDGTCVDIGMRRGEMAEQYPVPVAANTDAVLASLRAEGVDTYADFLAGLGWHEQDIKNVRNFAAQLRSQSEQVKGVQS